MTDDTRGAVIRAAQTCSPALLLAVARMMGIPTDMPKAASEDAGRPYERRD